MPMSKHERLEWLLDDVSEWKCLVFQSALREHLKTGKPLEKCLGIEADHGFRPVQIDKTRRRNELLIEAANALPPSTRPWVALALAIKNHNRRWSSIRRLQHLPEAEWGTAKEFIFLAHQIDPSKPLPSMRSLREILKNAKTSP